MHLSGHATQSNILSRVSYAYTGVRNTVLRSDEVFRVGVINDFRFFLRREIHSRQKKDPNYSLRQYAKDLNMSAQRLHGVLNERCGLSPIKAAEVCQYLDLTDIEKELFIALASAGHSRSKLFRAHAQQKVSELSRKMESFSLGNRTQDDVVIYLAAYALIETEGFKPDLAWISDCLGTSVQNCEKIYDQFFKFGYLIKSIDGNWLKSRRMSSLPPIIPRQSSQFYLPL